MHPSLEVSLGGAGLWGSSRLMGETFAKVRLFVL